jgi:hypothetical protein
MAMVLGLGGCVAESRIDEYQAEAEALSERLGAEVPDELIVGDVFVNSSIGYGIATGPVWAHVYRDYNLVDEAGASERAAAAMAAVLEDEGWRHGRMREADGVIYDGYGRDKWNVEIQWTDPNADVSLAERISIAVTSPATARDEYPVL